MDPIKTLALDLLNQLKPEDIKKIKSHIGLLELTCDIVEEAYQRLKKSQLKIDSRYKKQLALDLSVHVLDFLVKKQLIDNSLADNIKKLLKIEDINKISDLIDDIIGIWNDAKYYTFRFCSCLKSSKRSIRKLEHLKVQHVKNKDTVNVNFSSV